MNDTLQGILIGFATVVILVVIGLFIGTKGK